MIGFRSKQNTGGGEKEPRGYDAFEVRLGDMMRGERATLGKSLLDVERELRIKAAYVAAIENCDPDAFDTPGFIPGYVRSYARYLNMDPDTAFTAFCEESGFSIAHGMQAEASSIRRPDALPTERKGRGIDGIGLGQSPFAAPSESFVSRIEPGAVGSVLVLIALIGGLGYGGWSVLNEVQRVQFAPVENTPTVLSDLDPLQGATVGEAQPSLSTEDVEIATNQAVQQTAQGQTQLPNSPSLTTPRDDRLDRLFRPEALDVPVLVARDAPISTLDPAEVGAFGQALPEADRRSFEFAGYPGDNRVEVEPRVDDPQTAETTIGSNTGPKVLADQPTSVRMVAVRPAWVRVRGANGTVFFEGIMNACDTYDVPVTEEAPTLRVGESGAVYFAMNGSHFGPAGPSGQVTSGLPLDAQMLADALPVADITDDADLQRYVAEAQTGNASAVNGLISARCPG